jgi:hypothetical protein
LPPGKNPLSQYPLNRGLGGPQSRSGGFGKEKKSYPKVYLISEMSDLVKEF